MLNVPNMLIKHSIKLQQLALEWIIFSFYLNFDVFKINVVENVTNEFSFYTSVQYFIIVILSKQNVDFSLFSILAIAFSVINIIKYSWQKRIFFGANNNRNSRLIEQISNFINKKRHIFSFYIEINGKVYTYFCICLDICY